MPSMKVVVDRIMRRFAQDMPDYNNQSVAFPRSVAEERKAQDLRDELASVTSRPRYATLQMAVGFRRRSSLAVLTRSLREEARLVASEADAEAVLCGLTSARPTGPRGRVPRNIASQGRGIRRASS